MPDPATPTSTATNRWATVAAAILVGALAAVPFLPAIKGGFSDFDDHGFLLEVDGWRGLGPFNILWMFTNFVRGHYQPLTYLSYAIEYSIFGLKPAVYHAINILLHAGSAVLLFMLILRVLALEFSRSPSHNPHAGTRLCIAAGAAGLWAVHPLRVESVAWITERRDVLSCLLLLGSTLAYIRHATNGERPGRGKWLVMCLGLLCLSMLAKAWGMTFCAVALFMDIRPLRRLRGSPAEWMKSPNGRAVLSEKVWMGLMGLGTAALAFGAQSEGATRALRDWGVPERLVQTAYGLHFYIDRTLVPRHLALLYEVPASINPGDPKWAVPIVLVVMVIAALLVVRKRFAGLVVAFLCYAALVSPVLGLLQSGMQLVADRYSHIPTIPLFIAGACGVGALLGRAAAKGFGGAALAGTALATGLCLAVLSGLTWKQSQLWQDDSLLWQTSITNGADGPSVRNYYATHLEGQGQLVEAEAQYRKSLELNTRFSDSWFGLGSVLNKQGRHADAAEAFRQAALCAQDPAPALMMLGVLCIGPLNSPKDAIAAFQGAVEITDRRGNPEKHGRPYLLLAAALGQTGQEEKAVEFLKKAAEYSDSRIEAEKHLRDLGVRR